MLLFFFFPVCLILWESKGFGWFCIVLYMKVACRGRRHLLSTKEKSFLASNLFYNPICKCIGPSKFRFLLSLERPFQSLAALVLQNFPHFPSKCGSTQPSPGDMIILLKQGSLTWISSKMWYISSAFTSGIIQSFRKHGRANVYWPCN